MSTLYDHYADWSMPALTAPPCYALPSIIPKATAIDEIKLESHAVGDQPALCLTPALRKEIEALAAGTLQ
ncbi:MAG: hypothetical protein R3E79_09950 [Caldilineaceae bacterium]